jgi:hypothetical protein
MVAVLIQICGLHDTTKHKSEREQMTTFFFFLFFGNYFDYLLRLRKYKRFQFHAEVVDENGCVLSVQKFIGRFDAVLDAWRFVDFIFCK